MKIKTLINRLQYLDSLFSFDVKVALEIVVTDIFGNSESKKIEIKEIELSCTQALIRGEIYEWPV
jgi:hypothetical protein